MKIKRRRHVYSNQQKLNRLELRKEKHYVCGNVSFGLKEPAKYGLFNNFLNISFCEMFSWISIFHQVEQRAREYRLKRRAEVSLKVEVEQPSKKKREDHVDGTCRSLSPEIHRPRRRASFLESSSESDLSDSRNLKKSGKSTTDPVEENRSAVVFDDQPTKRTRARSWNDENRTVVMMPDSTVEDQVVSNDEIGKIVHLFSKIIEELQKEHDCLLIDIRRQYQEMGIECPV